MRNRSEYKRHAKVFGAMLGLVFLAATLLHWGWNTFAAEVLAMPEIEFRQALALELCLLSIAAVLPMGWRIAAPRIPCPGSSS